MKSIELQDELFRGAVSLERTSKGVKPWRIHFGEAPLFYERFVDRAGMTAGVRLRFWSDTERVQVEFLPGPGERQIDCVVDGELVATAEIAADQSAATFEGLPAREKWVELYLPQAAPMQVCALRVDDEAIVRVEPDDRPRWVTYGSSITQCASAASPAQTWPALVARRNDLNFTCLGYRGECHIEPMVALMMRDLPADFISLCLGINVQASETLGPRTFRSAVIGFLKILRERHATTPIAVISPIISPPRETRENKLGLSLEKMRAEIQTAVDILRQLGDENVHYVNGLELFGSGDLEHLPDQVHPDAEGYRIMAARFEECVLKRVVPYLANRRR